MVLLWYYNGNIMVLLWYYHRVYLGGTGEEHRRVMRGRTNLKHGKFPSSCAKDKISKVRKNEILGYKKIHLVGWKCYYDYEEQLCISSFASFELSGRQHYA